MENIYNDFFITEQELAKMLKVNTNTVRTWVHRELIPPSVIFKLPNSKRGTIRFIKDKIMDWLIGGSISARI